MRASRTATLLVAATLPFAYGAAVSAHRQDEFLQAARIAVEPDRVHLELSLTPGIAIADGVIRDIDANGDGLLSAPEQEGYAARVLGRVALHVDEAPPLRLSLASSRFPDAAALRTGDAAIELRVEALSPAVGAGPLRLFFRNDHAPDSSLYLANALVPESDRVAVTGQQHDVNQRELVIAFTMRDAPRFGRGWTWMILAGGLALVAPLARRAGVRLTPQMLALPRRQDGPTARSPERG